MGAWTGNTAQQSAPRGRSPPPRSATPRSGCSTYASYHEELAPPREEDRSPVAVIAVPYYEPVVLARWAFRALLERLAAAVELEADRYAVREAIALDGLHFGCWTATRRPGSPSGWARSPTSCASSCSVPPAVKSATLSSPRSSPGSRCGSTTSTSSRHPTSLAGDGTSSPGDGAPAGSGTGPPSTPSPSRLPSRPQWRRRHVEGHDHGVQRQRVVGADQGGLVVRPMSTRRWPAIPPSSAASSSSAIGVSVYATSAQRRRRSGWRPGSGSWRKSQLSRKGI